MPDVRMILALSLERAVTTGDRDQDPSIAQARNVAWLLANSTSSA
jgi:hypothetical protein